MASSKSHRADLPVLQKWMQAVITHVGGVANGIDSSAARQHIDVEVANVESVVTRSEKRTSVERLEVYANAYHARLVECLKSIFPIFAQTVGDELFYEFAVSYLQQYPSTSYTLNRLGDHFPDFLEKTSPNYGTDTLAFEEFLVGLAVVERSIDEVFDGPGFERQAAVSPQTLEGMSPEVFWESRLKTVPCLRLHSFPFPINDFITQAKQSPDAEIPEFQPSWLALSRREYVVRRIPLTRFEYHVLARLEGGLRVGDAVENAMVEVGEPEDLPGVVAAAFRKFAAEQLFLSIQPGNERTNTW
ncbi:hypothetical protein GC197_13975 [bacterium]|nr:hypothetical protein [bacterium]